MSIQSIKLQLKLINDCYEFIIWKLCQNHRKNRNRLKVKRLSFIGCNINLKQICVSIPNGIEKLEKSPMQTAINKEKNYIEKNQI